MCPSLKWRGKVHVGHSLIIFPKRKVFYFWGFLWLAPFDVNNQNMRLKWEGRHQWTLATRADGNCTLVMDTVRWFSRFWLVNSNEIHHQTVKKVIKNNGAARMTLLIIFKSTAAQFELSYLWLSKIARLVSVARWILSWGISESVFKHIAKEKRNIFVILPVKQYFVI